MDNRVAVMTIAYIERTALCNIRPTNILIPIHKTRYHYILVGESDFNIFYITEGWQGNKVMITNLVEMLTDLSPRAFNCNTWHGVAHDFRLPSIMQRQAKEMDQALVDMVFK